MSSQGSPLNFSNSFGWPTLSGAKVKQINPEKSNKTQHKNNNDSILTNDSGLNTIKEASNENSAASSRKTSVAISNGKSNDQGKGTNESNWWFWNGKIKEEQHSLDLNIDMERLDEVDTVQTEWAAPYKKMSSALSYYYNTSTFKSTEGAGENTPLLLNDIQSSRKSFSLPENESSKQTFAKESQEGIKRIDLQQNAQQENAVSSWFSWFGFANNNDDSDESLEGTSNPELFKQAKLAIESSKDSSNYALKKSMTSNEINDFELAVSDTKTESQPVKHRSKKRPLMPNETQERALQPPSNPTTANGVQQPLQNPPANSSSSSVTSNERLNVHLSETSHHCLMTPHIHETFRTITFVTRLRLMGEHLLCHMNPTENHLYSLPCAKVQNKRLKVKKVVIIGVHSFLPIKMVKTLIGLSTGSSINIVEEATKAMKTWLHENGTSNLDYEIQTIALEGEGTIKERVDKLFKLLKNWIDIISNCDFLFVASHSLGTPVAIHLLAKLLEHHPHISSRKKIGLLSMCGMYLGPIVGLNSKLVIRAYSPSENRILNELFDLQRPNSEVSIRMIASMQNLVQHDVKLTFCGSIDDQLVPIFSSIGVNFSHPNVFKCLFVDKHTEVPKFLVSLLKIILIMKNLGYSDHNLLRDLSEKCTGTLADGGHCKIFQHEIVYLTAIRHSLETTTLVNPKGLLATPLQNYKQIQNNQFHIPWNIRGLLNDLLKIKNIPSLQLINILIKDFHDWTPTQKKWKDLKYCFNAFEEIELEDLFL
mmetsp:Transcript_4192/g.4136  ORF Transcript_4192/g.4136 Transcript_4192/m.4136 type:complete len:764 (-) Transcript_4192:2035-4326(-)